MGSDELKLAAAGSSSRQRFRFFSLAPLQQKLSQSLYLARFIVFSSNEMMAYHRRVVGAAAVPLLFAMGSLAAYSGGLIHTLFMRRAIQFIVTICTLYSADIVRTKLLPRQQVSYYPLSMTLFVFLLVKFKRKIV